MCWVHKGLVDVFDESGVVTQSSQAFWVFTRGESKEPSHKGEEIHQQFTWKREVCNFIDWITLEYRIYGREPGRPLFFPHLSNFPSLKSDLLNFNLNTFWTALFILKKLLRIYLKDKTRSWNLLHSPLNVWLGEELDMWDVTISQVIN